MDPPARGRPRRTDPALAADGLGRRKGQAGAARIAIELDIADARGGDAPGPAGQSLRMAERRLTLPDNSAWRLSVARRKDDLAAEMSAFRRALILSFLALGAASLGAAAALTTIAWW